MRRLILSCFVLAALAAAVGGCKSPPPEAREVTPTQVRDVPAPLRGTVGSETTLRNHEPVLVSGYGLVVGLRGTGGGAIPERVAASMEKMLGMKGIGAESDALQGTALEGQSPRELLRSPDVAVVIVYGAIIPGAPEGTPFDVYVTPVSQAPDQALEGGTLWTTELRLGPPTLEGGTKTTEIAAARGPIFVNPFASPGSGPSRQQGRVLGGGVVTKSLPLQVVLDNESHGRARAIAEAINTRFGKQATRDDLIARGRSARTLEINVPRAYRTDAGGFLNVMLAVQIEQGFPQEFAKRYADALKTDPYLSSDLSWALEALPQRAALPFIRELYDSSDLGPKLAALRAGAGLNDVLAVPHLQRLAMSGPTVGTRADALSLLGRIQGGPAVDAALREQLGAPELSIRVAAYEALASRAEIELAKRIAAAQERLPAGAVRATPEDIMDRRSMLRLSGESVQGVERDVVGDRFLLDQVEGGEPLVYVAQQGRPRIVLFGERLEVQRPVVFSMWNDRLMVAADGPTDELRVLYRGMDRPAGDGTTIPGEMVTARAPANLPGFVRFLAKKPTPEDPRIGLNLTYSEVVGVLYEMQRRGVIRASFAVEEDLLQARLLAATQQLTATDRPDTPAAAERQLRVMEPVREQVRGTTEPEKPARELVVPLPPPAKK